jgi:hypothetical protein
MGQILSILWEILSILWEICYLIGIFRNHSPPRLSTTILESFSGKFFLTTRAQSETESGKFLSAPLIFSFPYTHGSNASARELVPYVFDMLMTENDSIYWPGQQ